MKNKLTTTKVLFICILLIASFFRFYGVNWDQNQHLHPDERFLTMVAGGISWPKDIGEYLDTATSPLNPHNRGFGFFVYGTFPIFFTKWVAESLNLGDYNNLTIVGRQLSALFDLGTVVLVFLIGKEILRNKPIGLLAAFFYAASVLPIQLSHFFAVETYLTFFITLSFYLLVKLINSSSQPTTYNTSTSLSASLQLTTILGISFGLAIASKITALLFLPIIGLGLFFTLIKNRNIFSFFVLCSLLSVLCYLTIRLAQPYLFANGNIFDISLNQKVLDNWKQLKSFDDKSGGFPPAVQWIKTKPYLFPLKNIVLWGLGLPLGIISIASITYYVLSITYLIVKRKINLLFNTYYIILSLSLLWTILLFFYQGSQFSKALRYFFPIYPFLAILSSWFVLELFNLLRKKFHLHIGLPASIATPARKDSVSGGQSVAGGLGYLIIGLLIIIYPLSFISVYSQLHSRIQASAWVYKNIPPGSKISGEHWDDFIPMSLPTPGFIHEKYPSIEFPLYNPDTVEKWKDMNERLKKVDYIILTSNRLYGSITTVSEKYPITNRYYQALFDGSLGFKKIAEFTSRPNLPIPFIKICLTPPFARYGIVALKSQECTLSGISFVDDYADETFTVYDHPKVTIFKKIESVDYYQILYR